MFFNYNKRKTQRNEGKNSSKTRWQEARKRSKKVEKLLAESDIIINDQQGN